MPAIQHKTLAAGQWQEFTLMEQLGNIGSEISRARNWHGTDDTLFTAAVFRALELIDLTVADPRWRYRLKEILRARECAVDAYYGGREYGTTWEDLDRYFLPYALAARKNR